MPPPSVAAFPFARVDPRAAAAERNTHTEHADLLIDVAQAGDLELLRLGLCTLGSAGPEEPLQRVEHVAGIAVEDHVSDRTVV